MAINYNDNEVYLDEFDRIHMGPNGAFIFRRNRNIAFICAALAVYKDKKDAEEIEKSLIAQKEAA